MDDDILREFLVGLGFKVDEVGMKKFTDSVATVTKGVMAAGVAIAATATAIVAGVAVISNQMEKLYYASQRTGETVGNLMALRYAAGQIGLTADQAQGALEGFARTLRLNPGTNNLLTSLGVTGDGPAAKFESFIEQMKKQKPYVAAAYAGLFGIDPDTLLMLENGLSNLDAAQARYRAKLAAFHIDPDQAAAAGKDFDNSIRDLNSDVHLFWVLLQEHLAPVLRKIVDQFEGWEMSHADVIAGKIATALEAVANWVAQINWNEVGSDVDVFLTKAWAVAKVIGNIVGAFANLASWLTGTGGGSTDPKSGPSGADPSVDSQQHPGETAFTAWIRRHVDKWSNDFNGTPDADVGNGSGNWDDAGQSSNASSGALFEKLERAFGLAPGTLDKVWGIESGRGKHMLSPAGAKGHFGFMDDTAKQYGVSDPNDLTQSATGAAKYLHDLMSKYGGDMMKALAAYNWGGGNLDKDIDGYLDKAGSWHQGHGADWANYLPKETAGYLDKFSGTRLGANGGSGASPVNIAQTNTFHIDGSSDPQGTARAIGNEQSRVNGDLVRNFSGAFH